MAKKMIIMDEGWDKELAEAVKLGKKVEKQKAKADSGKKKVKRKK